MYENSWHAERFKMISVGHMYSLSLTRGTKLTELNTKKKLWIILPGKVMSRTMHYINYLFNYVVINGCDYVWLQTSGNTLRKCC